MRKDNFYLITLTVLVTIIDTEALREESINNIKGLVSKYNYFTFHIQQMKYNNSQEYFSMMQVPTNIISIRMVSLFR